MEIKNQICSIRQAEQLKELGINWPSYFVFDTNDAKVVEVWMIDGTESEFVNAYTAAELYQGLPEFLTKDGKEYRFKIWRYEEDGASYFSCCYECRHIESFRLPKFSVDGRTQASCYAEMLIALFKEGYITPDQVNEKLSR